MSATKLKQSLKLIDKYIIRSVTDVSGVITDASEAFCKISGYSKDELIGKPHSIIRHPDTQKDTFKELWNTIKSGKTWEGEIKNLNKNGDVYWVKAHIEPHFNKNGKIDSFVAVREDITNAKALEYQMEQNSAIIRFASSGIGTMDLEGNFLSVNGAYTKLFGYTENEMVGKNCIDMSNDEFKDISKKSLKIAYQVGTLVHLEKVCKHKDGSDVYVEISLDLLPDKKSFVAVVNSLEDKKRLENINRFLEYKVNNEVNKNIMQLKKIQQEQLKTAKLTSIGSLAAGITHEINTPLTYIKGNFEMMKYDIKELKDSDIKSRLLEDSVKVSDGINRIANIVEAMREVSQSSSESREVVNIYSTLVTALTLGYNRSKQISRIFLNEIEFNIDIDKNLYQFQSKVQKQRIEQVWIIIINNALDELVKLDKYENRSFNITIEEKDNFVIVKFKDNAGGISENIIDKIFEPFVSTKEHGGVGVGLNIAQKIIKEHNGSIKAYNEDNGAVFEIKLMSL